MIFHAGIVLLRVISWLVFILAVLWPTASLIMHCVFGSGVPEGGFVVSGRQWALLGRSFFLSACATGLCLILSVPAALWVARCGRVARRPLFVACFLGVLLCPATIPALGWERIVASGIDPSVRCVCVWALWAWPIPALLVGSGWSRSVRPVYEAARLSAGAVRCLVEVAAPLLMRFITLSALIVFILFMGDYGVPHACLLRVYSTELLGWAASSNRTIDAVWPTWPVVITTLVLLVLLCRVWRGVANVQQTQGRAGESFQASGWVGLLPVLMFVVSWLWPVGTLAATVVSLDVIVESLSLYVRDLVWSFGTSVLAGVLSVVMGVGIVFGKTWTRLALSWAVVFGALPGAVIGAALVGAYNSQMTAWVYDHWIVVVLSYVARFGWVAVGISWLIRRSVRRDLLDQAAVDGAGDGVIMARVHVPMYWPTLLLGIAVVAALSLSDVASSSLVRVPDFNPVAHVMIEKFHRFEDGMLVSLSLVLVVASLPPALFIAYVMRRLRGS